MQTVFALMFSIVLVLFANGEALAADRSNKFALVIGNAKYPDSDFPLDEAIYDARVVADELKVDNFDVEIGLDLTRDAMRQALNRLFMKIEQGSVALIFFDGFGIQSDRRTYLIPVDAQIWTERDTVRDGFDFEAILGEMSNRGAQVKIALLDASRRNPFERRFRRYSAGLAPAITPSNTLVLYSAALGAVASDSKNNHSLFTTELLREIRVPGVSGEQSLRNTQAGVARATNGEQVPWLSSSLATEFSFTQTNKFEKKDKIGSSCETVKPDDPPSSDELARDPMIRELTRRISTNRNDRAAYYRRGQIYAIKHAYSLAVLDFNEVIKLNPNDSQAYNNRCWTLAATGDLLRALEDCEEALRISPGLADALDSRGLVNLKMGRTSDSIRDYSEALQKNPRSASSLFGRGIAKQRGGTNGYLDLSTAKSIDPGIVKEFAGYSVTECEPDVRARQ
jgi:regulator of sirC expression with transglutaminase-like and TPR domain